MYDQVKEYVSKMVELGYSEAKIRSELGNAGWSESVISNALTGAEAPIYMAQNAQTSSIPKIPSTFTGNNVKHSSLMVGFLYVLKFLSLWIGAVAFILASMSLIDKVFPPIKLYSYDYGRTTVVDYALNGYVATLIVTVPIFIFLFIYLKKQILAHPEFSNYLSRKILIVLTLIAAFLTIVIDLISVTTNFLNGDVSIGYVLKVVVILFVLIPIFTYYYFDLTHDKKHNA